MVYRLFLDYNNNIILKTIEEDDRKDTFIQFDYVIILKNNYIT